MSGFTHGHCADHNAQSANVAQPLSADRISREQKGTETTGTEWKQCTAYKSCELTSKVEN